MSSKSSSSKSNGSSSPSPTVKKIDLTKISRYHHHSLSSSLSPS